MFHTVQSVSSERGTLNPCPVTTARKAFEENSKFIKPAVIVEGLKNDDGLLSVDFKDKANHVTNSNLVIGYVTKQTVQNLLKKGISGNQQQCETVLKFYLMPTARMCFVSAIEPLAYILGLPYINGSGLLRKITALLVLKF